MAEVDVKSHQPTDHRLEQSIIDRTVLNEGWSALEAIERNICNQTGYVINALGIRNSQNLLRELVYIS